MPTGARPGYPSGTIAALGALLDEVTAAGVRYCHWKSNEHLDAGLAGRTDLDLLVHRDDLATFRALLGRSGLKPLRVPPEKRFPGMEHWLGCDRSTGKLFHLHVHDRLVLGEEHVKNHHLPLEGAFLASTRLLGGVPVPSPELELGVLAVRALLKYRPRDLVKDVLGIRSPGLRRSRLELEWLLARTTPELVGSALRDAGQAVPADRVVRFLEAYRRDPRAGTAFWATRARLRWSLRRSRRVGSLGAVARKLAATARRRTGVARRMTPPVGGLTIGVVGADGSGKSTIVGELERRLGWKLDVRTHYLGSKSPSPPSRWSSTAYRALRRGHRLVEERRGSGALPARALGTMRDVAFSVHRIAIGADRSRRVRRGRRQADRGIVVVFDRYPLLALSARAEHQVLDGPRIRSSIGAAGRVVRALAGSEERAYRSFGLPDLLVVLEVSPAVAAARKPDHDVDVLVPKARAATELADLAEGSGLPTIRIDADRPLDAVLVDVMGRLWDEL